MALRISGPGVGLPLPTNLYPTDLNDAPLDIGTAFVGLPPGDVIVLPAGEWIVETGSVSVLQFLDPITGTWRDSNATKGQAQTVNSDGFTRRVANLTGCPIGAVVAGGGTLYAQATASIAANLGGSLWQAVVGGSLTVSTIINPGSGFTIRPNVIIPDPPSVSANGIGGVPAVATCTLANATVTAVALSNVGAGYIAATVAALIVPSPFDPNLGSITNGTVNFVLTNSGLITAALCTNNGAPLATLSALTLTASGGAGSGATITPVILQTVASAGVVAGGAVWGDVAHPALITSVGGLPVSVSAPVIGNPAVEFTGYRPRQFVISGTCNAGGTITAVSIQDPGLFVGTPTVAIVAGNGLIATTLASVTVVMGSLTDTVQIQPK
jgi:hypothetical protein